MTNHLPEDFLQSIQQVKGFDKEKFVAIHQPESEYRFPVSVRINQYKKNDQFQQDPLIPWCTNGHYLPERPYFTYDPLFHAGTYYVQEASSMFLQHIIATLQLNTKPIHALDLCGAPGGKSTLLLSVLPQESIVVCNEVIKPRVSVLQENISKWGATNAIVTNNDPKDFTALENCFDLLVVDAPCSGSGMFRKDKKAIDEWNLNNVALCSQRQQRILADTIICLKEDGVLIYSTCSYSKEENEDICDWIIESFSLESIQLTIDPNWHITETVSDNHKAYGYRFYPYLVEGEGFFCACFVKKETNNTSFKRNKSIIELASSKELKTLSNYITQPNDLAVFKHDKEYRLFPKSQIDFLNQLRQSLYVKKAGLKIGELVNEELIPDHELALINDNYNSILSNYQCVELDKETALNYLRKQSITLTQDVKGWILLTYQSRVLGFGKATGNRINNYYTKEWRILK